MPSKVPPEEMQRTTAQVEGASPLAQPLISSGRKTEGRPTIPVTAYTYYDDDLALSLALDRVKAFLILLGHSESDATMAYMCLVDGNVLDNLLGHDHPQLARTKGFLGQLHDADQRNQAVHAYVTLFRVLQGFQESVNAAWCGLCVRCCPGTVKSWHRRTTLRMLDEIFVTFEKCVRL